MGSAVNTFQMEIKLTSHHLLSAENLYPLQNTAQSDASKVLYWLYFVRYSSCIFSVSWPCGQQPHLLAY